MAILKEIKQVKEGAIYGNNNTPIDYIGVDTNGQHHLMSNNESVAILDINYKPLPDSNNDDFYWLWENTQPAIPGQSLNRIDRTKSTLIRVSDVGDDESEILVLESYEGDFPVHQETQLPINAEIFVSDMDSKEHVLSITPSMGNDEIDIEKMSNEEFLKELKCDPSINPSIRFIEDSSLNDGLVYGVHIIGKNEVFGMDHSLINLGPEPLVEIYDASSAESHYGKYIARYPLSEILSHQLNTGFALDKEGYTMNSSTFDQVRGFAAAFNNHSNPQNDMSLDLDDLALDDFDLGRELGRAGVPSRSRH